MRQADAIESYFRFGMGFIKSVQHQRVTNTSMPSSNETPCFFRFASAFLGSQSYYTHLYIYVIFLLSLLVRSSRASRCQIQHRHSDGDAVFYLV